MAPNHAVRDYLHKERERILEGLIQAAIDTLHHDTDHGDDVDKYEREVLRKKFTAVLASHPH